MMYSIQFKDLSLWWRQICESFGNPNIKLDPAVWKMAESYYGPYRKNGMNGPIRSLELRNLAKIPEYLRNPEGNIVEMKASYEQMREEVQILRQRLKETTEAVAAYLVSYASGASSVPLGFITLHCRYQGAHCVMLSLAMLLNTILLAFDPFDAVLLSESAALFDETMILARDANAYRPLGSSYMPLCLIVARASTDDLMKRMEAETILMDYQTDFIQAKWLDIADWLELRLRAIRFKQLMAAPDSTNDTLSEGIDIPFEDMDKELEKFGSCCIL